MFDCRTTTVLAFCVAHLGLCLKGCHHDDHWRKAMTNSNDLMEAMEIMARAVGAHAICKYKYDRLRVEFPKLPDDDEQTKALYVFADLVEKAADLERFGRRG